MHLGLFHRAGPPLNAWASALTHNIPPKAIKNSGERQGSREPYGNYSQDTGLSRSSRQPPEIGELEAVGGLWRKRVSKRNQEYPGFYFRKNAVEKYLKETYPHEFTDGHLYHKVHWLFALMDKYDLTNSNVQRREIFNFSNLLLERKI